MPAAEIARTIRAHAGSELVSLRLFDIYRGSPLADGEKSLAWRLLFQSADRTLTDAEIEASLAAITASIASRGGRIRT